MRGAGAERVILALLSLRGLSVGAVLASIGFVVKRQAEDMIKNVYVCDALRLITENTAKSVNGAYLPKRYADIIGLTSQEKSKTVEEVKSELTKNGITILSGEGGERGFI